MVGGGGAAVCAGGGEVVRVGSLPGLSGWFWDVWWVCWVQGGNNPGCKLFVFSVSWVISTISRGVGPAEGGESQKGHVRGVRTCPYSFIIASCQGVERVAGL